MPTLLTEKKQHFIRDFLTVDGEHIPDFYLGYETYGQLSENHDNVILICHYFSGTSHAAGKYSENDPQAGWWDDVIGPEKAIDTNRFFVICSDTLVNQNTGAIASGPSSINPSTHQSFGLDFPEVTIRDFVNAQKCLLESMGIHKLYAIAGPSMGSMQAMTWAAAYPESVERLIAVIPAGLSSDAYLIERTQQWADSIRLDSQWKEGRYTEQPRVGLTLAIRQILLSALHPDTLQPLYGRRKKENGKFSVIENLNKHSELAAENSDANAILYLVKANQRYDLLEDEQQGDARNISAKILFITAETDLLLLPERAISAANWLRQQGKQIRHVQIKGSGGHLDGVTAIQEVEEEIRQFLEY